jgi:tyrosyl-tRNA synthetase
MRMSQDFIQIIKERGFVHQFTDEDGLATLLKTPEQRAYIGFDCTAKSLHVGSLLQIMLLRWWQKCGHQPIVLLGGGTTKIGDPSGKDEARPLLTQEAIDANMAGIRRVFPKLLDGRNVTYVDNAEWLESLDYIRFMRDYGHHFSINRMLRNKSVQLRLEREQEMSLLEFNYIVMQSYDFVELHKRYGCRLQMGGSDQWGNITQGIELQRRLNKGQGEGLFGLTTPLMTTASGAKMGKSEGGAVWLNEEMLPVYDYWQYWRNTEDADVVRFLKLFTDLPLAEIAKLGALKDAEINEAKKVLATEATALLHGREEATRAAQTAADTFSGTGVSENLPEITVAASDLAAGLPLYTALVQAGFATSNGEARRLIKGNGVRVNDTVVADDNSKLTTAQMADGFIKLSAGKKRHVLVKAN